MWFGIITLFPKIFNVINFGITGKAVKSKLIEIQIWNPRDYTTDKHKNVDSPPYGGESGMLMTVQPLKKAISEAKKQKKKATVIYLSPQGKKLKQKNIKKLCNLKNIILICGRYKGIDERLFTEIDEEWSIGDYILSGGEIAALVFIDVLCRLIPGVLKKNSIKENSFSFGLLDCPQYTKPAILNKMEVPKILLSGHHEKIRIWKLKQSLGKTWLKRPDLLKKIHLSQEQKELLLEFKDEFLKKRLIK